MTAILDRPPRTADLPIYLVMHGINDLATERLTTEGVRQAEQARDRIKEMGLGHKAVILSNSLTTDTSRNAIAVAETARIIHANGLLVRLVESTILGKASQNPRAVDSIEHLVSFALDREGITDASGVVVVTQLPLIQPLKLTSADVDPNNRKNLDVQPGEVVQYNTGSWPTSPDFFLHTSAMAAFGDDVRGLYPDLYASLFSATQSAPAVVALPPQYREFSTLI